MITDANITAAIAWLIENQDETDSISNSTASSYFGSIITVAVYRPSENLLMLQRRR